MWRLPPQLVFILITLVAWNKVRGQAPPAQLGFQQVTTLDGLSDNRVTCLLEDRTGHIWIGTERGLNRYDGQHVEQFTGDHAPDDLHISSLAEDSAGTIWATTTADGLFAYQPASGSFRQYRHSDKDERSIPSDQLNHVTALNDSVLVISTRDKGMVWFNTKSGKWHAQAYHKRRPTPYNDTSGTNAFWCHSTLRLDSERLWMGMIPGGNSYLIDAFSGKVLREVTSVHADSMISLTNALVFGGELLAGGWGLGITRIALHGSEPPSYVPVPDEITSMVPWGKGLVLAGTKINGLVLLDGNLRPIARYHHVHGDAASLVQDRVRCLLKDHQGNLWAGTAGGLNVHAPCVWRMRVIPLFPPERTEQPNLTFHQISQDPDGTIRMATSHGFFTCKAPGLASAQHMLTYAGFPLEVTGLFPAGPMQWYVGTETGAFPYDPRWEAGTAGSIELARGGNPQGQGMFQVRSMILDTVWGQPALITGALGFAHMALATRTNTYLDWHPNYLTSNPAVNLLVHCTVRDAEGRYWNASDKGILKWSLHRRSKADSVEAFNREAAGEHNLQSDRTSMLAIHGDTIWAAMLDGSLVSIAGGKAQTHAVPTQMAKSLLGLTFSRDGQVWCTTDNGLVRYTTTTGAWLHVPVNDGRSYRQLNPCITTLQDGTIAFCANNCLVTFDPTAFENLPMLPDAQLTWTRNSWGPLNMDEKGIVRLPYRNGSFEAGLTALYPVGPAPLEFLYRLEDLETEPHLAGPGMPVRYAGLPVGTHRLLVSTRDAYGRTSTERPLLTLIITGPVWQQWWFYAALAVAGIGAVWAWSRYKLREALQMQAVRDGIARDLHDDIGSTLGSISYYSEALKRQIGAQDDQAREVADRIGSNSREMIERMGDIVWSIDPRNDTAGSLEQRISAYATSLLGSRGITLDFPKVESLLSEPLDARSRRMLFLIFKEALHNALKYAACTKVELALWTEDGQLWLRVSDNGAGFDVDNLNPYNGNGIGGMSLRAKSVGGGAVVRSRPGQGTEVLAHVPVSKEIPRNRDWLRKGAG